MKKTGPYVGVTGFMSLKEVAFCDGVFRKAVLGLESPIVCSELNLMVGILVSQKTLASGTNKWADRYPPVSLVPELTALRVENLLYTIHYNTDDAATIDEQIDQLLRLSPNIDALQLNMRWVSHVALQRIRRKYPDLRIILQIGAGALSDVAEPGEIYLGDALRAYEGVVDDFLVDPSGGKGEPADVWRAFACISDGEIPKNMRPGIAGGFCSENVCNVRGLMRRMLWKPVNIDAEGRLRTQAEGGGKLILEEAEKYIKASVSLIGEVMIYHNKLVSV